MDTVDAVDTVDMVDESESPGSWTRG